MTGRSHVREYEFIYIIQPDATPEREKEIQARVEKEIVAGGGQILLWDDWGKRKLAYEIRKFNKGHYMLVSFLGGGRFIPMRLNDFAPSAAFHHRQILSVQFVRQRPAARLARRRMRCSRFTEKVVGARVIGGVGCSWWVCVC